MTAKTPVLSTVHHPLGKKSLWHLPGNQELPAYIQNVAAAFMRNGMQRGPAIARAVGVIKDWAAGRNPNGKGHVTPQVQAAAAKTIAEWEAIRAKTKTHGLSNETEALEMSNDQRDPDGKFAARPEERERLIKKYQFQQGLPVTGKIDNKTKQLLTSGTEAISAVSDLQSAKLDENTRDFFRRSVG
jgi:hypothetical protein